MNKIERYRQILTPLLAKAAENRALADYLIKDSSLPGPRANLELAKAFADVLASSPIEDSRWNLLAQWAGICAE